MSAGPHVGSAPGAAADPAGQASAAAAGAAPLPPPGPVGGRHTARWVALGLAIPMLLLFAVLATREPAGTRVVPSPLVGREAPPIEGVAVVGEQTSLSELRGRFVVVNFFATWCVPCKEEHDDLVRFAEAHPDDGRVVSVVFSDDPDDVEAFFEQRGGDWPILRDEDGAVATAWGVARVPESYLVAPSGRVVGKITGGVTYDFLEEQLARLRRPAA